MCAMKSTLVLNAGFEPLNIIPARRAINLILNGKAVSIDDSPYTMRSEKAEHSVPYVVLRTSYVKVSHITRKIPFSRRWVLASANYTCTYCGKHASTIDHIVPRALGGIDSYENCVASCMKCNNKKAAKTLEELGWVMKTPPKIPSSYEYMAHRLKAKGELLDKWLPYFEPYAKQKIGF